jgi:glutathione S-transferase
LLYPPKAAEAETAEERFFPLKSLEPFPRMKAYHDRCHARPAWERTLSLYAERVGVSVEDIR